MNQKIQLRWERTTLVGKVDTNKESEVETCQGEAVGWRESQILSPLAGQHKVTNQSLPTSQSFFFFLSLSYISFSLIALNWMLPDTWLSRLEKQAFNLFAWNKQKLKTSEITPHMSCAHWKLAALLPGNRWVQSFPGGRGKQKPFISQNSAYVPIGQFGDNWHQLHNELWSSSPSQEGCEEKCRLIRM